jgi:cytidine deaminase
MIEFHRIEPGTAARLMNAARDALRHAYVPYSNFPVGAALLTEYNDIITGVNIENASYGLTCCAERAACFTGASAGHRTFYAVAVTATRVPTVTPCGACRQVLNEFKPRDRDMIVILDGAEPLSQIPLGDLLPRAFGPHDLGDANRGGGS